MGLQKWKVLLLFIWTYFLFIGTSVFADTIVPINNRDRIGLGKFDTSIETFFGDFKTCSTDSYFYFVLVNESTRDVEVYLPQRVFANDQYRQIDPEGYFYKALNPENWKMDQFADANSGSKLFIADDFTFTLPALSVYSIKGHVIGLPSTDSRDTDTVEKDDKISGELALLIDGTMLTASGNFKEEGSICTTIQIIPFAGTNFVSANYDIAPTGEETCSLAYYFVIENGDPKYGSTVDLPHWIFIDDDRWNIGCQYIYSGCRISGFRHYAWAEIIDGKMPANADYHFCDQDKAYGDYCYEQDGIWWLNVPAGKRFAVRSMVMIYAVMNTNAPIR